MVTGAARDKSGNVAIENALGYRVGCRAAFGHFKVIDAKLFNSAILL
jgi:hypothetical protein